MTIYEFESYKDFLKAKVEENVAERGYQSRMALAAGCQRAFISQVLHGQANLTHDHAVGLSEFWKLSEDETSYFLELVTLSKAGTPSLQSFIKKRLRKMRAAREKLPERYSQAKTLGQEAQLAYYSTWYMGAIHVLCSIPEFQTADSLAARLSLPRNVVDKSLSDLEAMGILQKARGGRWLRTERNLFLPKQSPMDTVNQMNWRQRAWHNLQVKDDSAFHYTTLHALSRNDKEKFLDLVRDLIDKTKALVEPSPEEEAICFTCDVFPL